MSKQTAAAAWVHVDTLQPWDRNPRNNDHAAEQLAGAIREFGFTAPLVVQSGTNRIIAGHTRQKAVRLILGQDGGWTAPGAPGPGMVPARFVDVDDETATRLTISDNRMGDLAVWDENILADLLQELDPSAMEHLGFDSQELDALLGTWEDPFANLDPEEEGELPQVDDQGTAKITVEVAIPHAQDLSQAFRTLLEERGIKRSEYRLVVK